MIRVSVLIAAHNAQSCLDRAIKSALADPSTEVEILVVDDASGDGTADLVQAWATRDPRVRLIRTQNNLGPGYARNLAMDAARGEWIAVLDADDAFAPERLASLLAFAEAEGADVVSDNLLLRDGATGETRGVMFPPGWLGGVLTPLRFVEGNIGRGDGRRLAYGFMKPVVRRDYLERRSIRYRISYFAEDYIFGLEMLLNGARWATIDTPSYVYDVSPTSATMTDEDARLEALIGAERDLLDRYPHAVDPKLQAAISQHLSSVELALAWIQFSKAVKTRNAALATAVLGRNPRTTGHILTQIARHVPRAFRKVLPQRTRPAA